MKEIEDPDRFLRCLNVIAGTVDELERRPGQSTECSAKLRDLTSKYLAEHNRTAVPNSAGFDSLNLSDRQNVIWLHPSIVRLEPAKLKYPVAPEFRSSTHRLLLADFRPDARHNFLSHGDTILFDRDLYARFKNEPGILNEILNPYIGYGAREPRKGYFVALKESEGLPNTPAESSLDLGALPHTMASEIQEILNLRAYARTLKDYDGNELGTIQHLQHQLRHTVLKATGGLDQQAANRLANAAEAISNDLHPLVTLLRTERRGVAGKPSERIKKVIRDDGRELYYQESIQWRDASCKSPITTEIRCTPRDGFLEPVLEFDWQRIKEFLQKIEEMLPDTQVPSALERPLWPCNLPNARYRYPYSIEIPVQTEYPRKLPEGIFSESDKVSANPSKPAAGNISSTPRSSQNPNSQLQRYEALPESYQNMISAWDYSWDTHLKAVKVGDALLEHPLFAEANSVEFVSGKDHCHGPLILIRRPINLPNQGTVQELSILQLRDGIPTPITIDTNDAIGLVFRHGGINSIYHYKDKASDEDVFLLLSGDSLKELHRRPSSYWDFAARQGAGCDFLIDYSEGKIFRIADESIVPIDLPPIKGIKTTVGLAGSLLIEARDLDDNVGQFLVSGTSTIDLCDLAGIPLGASRISSDEPQRFAQFMADNCTIFEVGLRDDTFAANKGLAFDSDRLDTIKAAIDEHSDLLGNSLNARQRLFTNLWLLEDPTLQQITDSFPWLIFLEPEALWGGPQSLDR